MLIIFLTSRTIGNHTYQSHDIADLPNITAKYLIKINVASAYIPQSASNSDVNLSDNQIENIASHISEAISTSKPDNNENLISLEFAMDKTYKTPLQVQLPVDLKQEPDGGLLIADMKGPFVWNSANATQPFYLDCTGYKSILVHKITTGIVTPYVSNDGKTWNTTVAVATATGTPAATILTAAGMYVLPVVSKMIQLVGPASAIQCFIYLSQTPQPFPQGTLQALANNITQVAGSAIVTGGLAGILSVGGNVANNVAPTANPVQIGGVDALKIPLTRRILVDEYGRQQVGNIPSQLQKGVNTLGFDPSYRNVLEVQDTKTVEGNSKEEILKLILNELKILNLQMNQLPGLINIGVGFHDCVDDYRNDNSLIN